MTTPATVHQLYPSARTGPLLPAPPRPKNADRARVQRNETLMFMGIGLVILIVSAALFVWAHADTHTAKYLQADGQRAEIRVTNLAKATLGRQGVVGAIVGYEFKVDGRTFSRDADIRGHDQKELWAGYVKGGSGTVLYDPQDPATNMLDNEITDVLAEFPWAYISLLGVLLGLFLVGGSLRNGLSGDKVYLEGREAFAEVVELQELDGVPMALLSWEGGTGLFGAEHEGDEVFKFLPGYEPFVAPVPSIQSGDRVAVLISPDGGEALLLSELLLQS